MLLSAAFAVWGLAIAIALLTIFDRPAPPDQMMGAAKVIGFDAHGPFRWAAALMLLPILVPLALRPVARSLADGRAWARHTAMIAPLVALWLVVLHRSVLWVTVPCAIVLAVCVVLRHRELAFTRRDAVLIPTFLTTLLGITDVAPALPADVAIYAAALLVLGVRIGVAFLRSPVAPALAFMLAPLGLVLQTGFFARDQRYFGWHALALVVITPFVMRLVLRDARRATVALAFVIYPLALYSYSHALSLMTAEGKPRVNFFEDGHSLLPASEYLRGERPYRDILPAHGLLEDGGIDAVAMQLGGASAGTAKKARFVVGNLVTVALYFLALAATGSPEGALFAVLLSGMSGLFRGSIRFLPPFLALAFLCAAVRLRRPRWFAYAAFFTVVCGITSLDFAFYMLVTLVVALIRVPRVPRSSSGSSEEKDDDGAKPPEEPRGTPRNPRNPRNFALIGLAAGAVPLFVIYALFGILDDFFAGTFLETLAVGPAYVLEFFTPTAALARTRAFPDVLAVLLERDSFPYLFWCAAVVFTGVTVTRRVPRRLEPIVLLGVFTVVSAISYAERHHLYFGMVAAVMVVYAILRLLRRRSVLAVPAILAALALASPTVHIGVLGWMRRARGPVEKEWVEIPSLPRARGALFHEADAAFINSAQKYVSLTLGPDETFFDFTNSGILYFLLRRDAPIREYEVAFYQTEAQQREIIRRIESNPRVRAALVPKTPQSRFTVDGIPNADRAPLVWQYLQTHFHPDFEEGDVVFWRRN